MNIVRVIVEHLLVIEILLLDCEHGEVRHKADDAFLELFYFSLGLGNSQFLKLHAEVFLDVLLCRRLYRKEWLEEGKVTYVRVEKRNSLEAIAVHDKQWPVAD